MAVSRGKKSTKVSKSSEVDKKERKPLDKKVVRKEEKKVELPKAPKVEEVKQSEVVVAPPEVKEEVVAQKMRSNLHQSLL